MTQQDQIGQLFVARNTSILSCIKDGIMAKTKQCLQKWIWNRICALRLPGKKNKRILKAGQRICVLFSIYGLLFVILRRIHRCTWICFCKREKKNCTSVNKKIIWNVRNIIDFRRLALRTLARVIVKYRTTVENADKTHPNIVRSWQELILRHKGTTLGMLH